MDHLPHIVCVEGIQMKFSFTVYFAACWWDPEAREAALCVTVCEVGLADRRGNQGHTWERGRPRADLTHSLLAPGGSWLQEGTQVLWLTRKLHKRVDQCSVETYWDYRCTWTDRTVGWWGLRWHKVIVILYGYTWLEVISCQSTGHDIIVYLLCSHWVGTCGLWNCERGHTIIRMYWLGIHDSRAGFISLFLVSGKSCTMELIVLF